MSINDLMNDDSFLPTLMVIFVIVIIIAIPAGIAMGKKTNKSIYGDGSYGAYKEVYGAVVLARRTTPHPLNQAVMINMVVFELPTGERIELAIKDATVYGTMIEGDTGILSYQGKLYLSPG